MSVGILDYIHLLRKQLFLHGNWAFMTKHIIYISFGIYKIKCMKHLIIQHKSICANDILRATSGQCI